MKSKIEMSQKILQKIKSNNIRPLPKWFFKVRTILLIMMFVFSVIFGSLSVSILWMNLRILSVYSQVQIGRGLGVLLVPSLWLFLSLCFFIIAFFHYRKSPGGYRTSTLKLVGSLTGISLVIGTALFLSGYSQSIHRFIRQQIPVYGSLQKIMNDMSCKPSEGMLCGRLDSIEKPLFNSKHVVLIAEDGQKWSVDIQEAKVRGLPRIEYELRMRIWGIQIDNENFKAVDIRPFPIDEKK